jgi:hypothetical protein
MGFGSGGFRAGTSGLANFESVSSSIFLNVQRDVIIDATVTGTGSTHVGSMFLNQGTASVRAMLGTSDTDFVTYVKLKRFTGGAEATILQTTSSFANILNLNVAIDNTDWYDVYLSSSNAATNALIKGLQITYTSS